MAIAQFLFRRADGRFIEGGFYEVQLPLVGDPPEPDTATYGVAEFQDADLPDLERDVYDPAHGKRRMTPEERDSTVAVPVQVSALQFKAALLQLGRLDEVERVITRADPLTQLAWHEATAFRPDSPMLQRMRVELGVTEAEAAAIFHVAAHITV